jgi:hypothetical protein
MNRDYADGVKDNVQFFTGIEVEHTPAFGLLTLFVTGVHPVQDIALQLNDQNSYTDTSKHIKHIFFGANHSFHPENALDWQRWESIIEHFLKQDYLCSLDIPLSHAEDFHEGGLCSYENFIPQIRVPIPYIKLWNYNTMVKIDDKGFKATNPGVWTHSLHDLQNRSKFTPWSKYKDDKAL